MESFLLLHKIVDKSVLTEGFSIPMQFQETVYRKLGFVLRRGETRLITVCIGSDRFQVKLINQPFDSVKYPSHGDILQVRYGKDVARKLKSIFVSTEGIVRAHYSDPTNKGKTCKISQDDQEILAVYATPVVGELVFDCISKEESESEYSEISSYEERCWEESLDYETDSNADIITRTGTYKVRRLSRAIGDKLKLIYDYHCQICGQHVGERYGSNIIHAHHIDYFTRSHNNNADNIIIVCPNHHAIIHDTNPEFERRNKRFIYPNGYSEALLLNQHL